MANVNEEGDLALFNNKIAGDIIIKSGAPVMDQGLETAVFISLFSGKKNTFWGNELVSNDLTYQYGGEFETTSEGMELTAQNALRLEEYIKRDLQWLIIDNIANEIQSNINIINSREFLAEILITKSSGETITFNFNVNWEQQFINPAHEKNN